MDRWDEGAIVGGIKRCPKAGVKHTQCPALLLVTIAAINFTPGPTTLHNTVFNLPSLAFFYLDTCSAKPVSMDPWWNSSSVYGMKE